MRKTFFPAKPLSFALLLIVLTSSIPFAFSRTSHRQKQGRTEQNTRSTPRKNLPAAQKRFALVVGVDKYADTQITTLGGASNDARLLSDALVRYAGFPRDQVVLLSSDQPAERQPTRGNILRRLSNLATIVPRDGLLLLFFAGHGIERKGQAFLLPSDAQVSDDVMLLEQTAVNVLQIKDWVKKTGVKQILLLIDACRNDPGGRADADNRLSETYTRGFNFDTRNREVEAFVTLYATAIGHRAYEYREKRHGYFTWVLVEGLRGAAANPRGEVTLDGLIKYLQLRVPKQVNLDLGAGKVQRPFAVVEGYKADELVLSVSNERGLSLVTQTPSDAATSNDSRARPIEEDSASSSVVKLEGTVWEGDGASGPYTIEFLPERKIRYTLLSNKRPVGGTWKLVGDFIQISIGSYSVLTGKVEGGVMKGEATNSEGQKWAWALTPHQK